MLADDGSLWLENFDKRACWIWRLKLLVFLSTSVCAFLNEKQLNSSPLQEHSVIKSTNNFVNDSAKLE